MKFIVFSSIFGLGLLQLASACGGPYAQCGGSGFAGEACCEPGYECVAQNEWYSQCQESSAAINQATQQQWNQQPQQQWNQPDQQQQWPQQWPQQGQPQFDWGQQQQWPQSQPAQTTKSIPNEALNTNPNNNQSANVPKSIPNAAQSFNNPTAPTFNQGGNQGGSSGNPFAGELFLNPRFTEEVESSIPKLPADLQEKARKVAQVPTAIWLAWEGAPQEVPGHLAAAAGKNVVFVLYLIPTRDCNANASAGGASDLNKYKGYVDSIANSIKSYQGKVAMIVEPDTLGNLVTGNSDACRNVHQLHKDALAYAVNVYGAMSNVGVYLDAAHGKWLGSSTDKVAAIIKEIANNAPNGKIRGIATNVSNYQPLSAESSYHQALSSALSAVGLPGMKFVVDTSRNGVDVSSTFNINQTWCNFVGTGLGERPQADPAGYPLLDAFMWIKTPGEADGSSTGPRADPVCARPDSLPGAPEAGSWFHDYFVQLLTNAKPAF